MRYIIPRSGTLSRAPRLRRRSKSMGLANRVGSFADRASFCRVHGAGFGDDVPGCIAGTSLKRKPRLMIFEVDPTLAGTARPATSVVVGAPSQPPVAVS